MNVINSSGSFKIFGDSVKTYNRLPVGTYSVVFNPNEGYSLVQKSDMIITEEKIYGNNQKKVDKAMKSYIHSSKNFGVLLSGDKGIGKTLFLKMLATSAIKEGIPVIVVSNSYPNIADFISSIEQDAIVVFDEFEKIFRVGVQIGNGPSPQDELLPLLDGTDCGHKMFVVTCNAVSQISYFMLNRPGRFHYHFELKPPTHEEITEYLRDKLNPEYHDNIEKIANLASVMNMPYDHLRAIVFEMNQGYSLSETMEDVNIGYDAESAFDIEVKTTDGRMWHAYGCRICLYKTELERCRVINFGKDGTDSLFVFFNPSEIKFKDNVLTVDGRVVLSHDPYYDEGDDDDDDENKKEFKFESIVFKKVISYSKHNYDV